MNYDVDPYHPRYAHTEFLTYEQRERRRRRMGVIGALLIVGSIVVGVILFKLGM